ncbi:hypothetical protein Tco_0660978 [Tanacetum coccineum]
MGFHLAWLENKASLYYSRFEVFGSNFGQYWIVDATQRICSKAAYFRVDNRREGFPLILSMDEEAVRNTLPNGFGNQPQQKDLLQTNAQLQHFDVLKRIDDPKMMVNDFPMAVDIASDQRNKEALENISNCQADFNKSVISSFNNAILLRSSRNSLLVGNAGRSS